VFRARVLWSVSVFRVEVRVGSREAYFCCSRRFIALFFCFFLLVSLLFGIAADPKHPERNPPPLEDVLAWPSFRCVVFVQVFSLSALFAQRIKKAKAKKNIALLCSRGRYEWFLSFFSGDITVSLSSVEILPSIFLCFVIDSEACHLHAPHLKRACVFVCVALCSPLRVRGKKTQLGSSFRFLCACVSSDLVWFVCACVLQLFFFPCSKIHISLGLQIRSCVSCTGWLFARRTVVPSKKSLSVALA